MWYRPTLKKIELYSPRYKTGQRIWYTWKSIKMTVFLQIALCSLAEVYDSFGVTYCLRHQGVNSFQTTRCKNPEVSHLITCHCKTLKSHELQCYILAGRDQMFRRVCSTVKIVLSFQTWAKCGAFWGHYDDLPSRRLASDLHLLVW